MAPRNSHQACINCRRKKTRCPGERPFCSSCTRLNQQCSYRDNNRPITMRPLEERLAHVESQLSIVLNERNSTTAPASELNTMSLQSNHTESHSIQKVLDIYLERCHRQPLHIFDREEIQSRSDLPQHLHDALFALVAHFQEYLDNEKYIPEARKTVMQAMTTSIDLDTIRSMAILAYTYLLNGNLRNGQFHINLGLQLCKYADMDHQSTYKARNRQNESKIKVYWSLQFLDLMYGSQSGALQRSDLEWPPFSSTGHEDCVRLFPSSADSDSTDIWKHSIEMAAIWSRIRRYVLNATTSNIIEPWRRDSAYVRIVADMSELETALPMHHRYDAAKFFNRSSQELRDNKDYWRPWLLIQFTYHAAQIALNHPFLYLALSLRDSKFTRSNTFWKKSMELVLLHSTWIARMINMVEEKAVELSDPSFACIAALAATVHMYFSCAPDQRLAAKSRVDLNKCRSFLKTFTSFSVFCKILEEKLDTLIHTALGGSRQPTKLRLDTDSIRGIMKLICQHQSASARHDGLLDESLRTHVQADIENNMVVEISVAVSPEIDVQISDGGQAAPLTPHTTFNAAQTPVVLSNEEVFQDSRWDWTLPEFEETRSNHPDITSRDLWDPSWWGYGNL